MLQTKKIKCLVVDDEPPAREILKQHIAGVDALELAGVCANAVEAISFLKDHPVDLIFLDIQMPGMTGFEMLEKLPAFDFHLVFTTSYDQYALKAFRFSAMDYLLKPIDKDELLRAIEKLKKISKTSPRQVEALLQKIRNPMQAINKITMATIENIFTFRMRPPFCFPLSQLEYKYDSP